MWARRIGARHPVHLLSARRGIHRPEVGRLELQVEEIDRAGHTLGIHPDNPQPCTQIQRKHHRRPHVLLKHETRVSNHKKREEINRGGPYAIPSLSESPGDGIPLSVLVSSSLPSLPKQRVCSPGLCSPGAVCHCSPDFAGKQMCRGLRRYPGVLSFWGIF